MPGTTFSGYVKGGAAVARDKYEGLVTDTGVVFDRATETRWGGVVGAGVEYGFAPNWSVALEYDHMFMGTRDTSPSPRLLAAGWHRCRAANSIRQDVDMVTARINYRFGGPIVARY